MAWRVVQTKSGPRRYYYQSERVKYRVKTHYHGRGFFAEWAALEQQQRHSARQALRQARNQQRQLGLETHRHIKTLLRAALVAEGYYRHARGRWRRRQYSKQVCDLPSPPNVDVVELTRRANLGSPNAIAALRLFLIDHPDLWTQTHAVAKGSLETLLSRLANESPNAAIEGQSWKSHYLPPGLGFAEWLVATAVLLSWAEYKQMRLGPTAKCNQLLGKHLASFQRGALHRYLAAATQLGFVRGREFPLVDRLSQDYLQWQTSA